MTKYESIRDDLVKRIANKDFSPSNRLPTEKELTEQYKVSRVTIRKAIDALEKSEVIYRRQGIGTFFDGAHAPGERQINSGITYAIQSRGYNCTVRVLTKEFISCNQEIADYLCISCGQRVLMYKRLYMADEQPLVVAVSYINNECLPGIELYDFNFISMSKAMELLCPANYHRRYGDIRAAAAEEYSEILCIDASAPMLCYDWVMTKPENGAEIPIEYTTLCQTQNEKALFF